MLVLSRAMKIWGGIPHMKKNIKYAGVAAATLFAVAPIATPAINGLNVAPTATQTAKATYGNAAQEDAYNAFDATFKNYNNATQADFLYGATFAGFEEQNRFTYNMDFLLNGILRPLHPQYQSALNDLDSSALLNEIVFVVVPPEGQTTSEWKNQMLGAAEHGGSVSYRIVGLSLQEVGEHPLMSNQQLVKYFSPYQLNGHALDKTVSAKTAITKDEIHAMNINYDTPLDGYVGENKADFDSNGKYPLTITDNKGNKIDPEDVTSTFYNGLNMASVINKTQLPKAGVVTQKMTIKFNRNEYRGLFADLSQINVNGKSYSSGMIGKVFDKVNNSVTLTRVINVGLDNYTDTKINGVVTTPIVNISDKNIVVPLYDGKGHQINRRSLAQGTDWFTDTKRVNNNGGEVWYRVSTNEWVKASDVTYADKTDDSNSGDGDTSADKGLTNIQSLPAGTVVSLGTKGYVYPLFGEDGTRLERGLPGDSEWTADKKATDAEGNTYYRVSSNEWVISGDGVTVK